MNLVIGSGPAGIAAACALLEHGREVTLLDTGIEMEDSAASKRRRLRAGLEAGDARPGNRRIAGSGLPMKTLFGSDFPYRPVAGCAPIEADDAVDVLMSYAQGGLSNLWGANMLPFSRNELACWPVPHAAMENAYRSVMPLIHLSAAGSDGLTGQLPLYTDRLEPRHLSGQAEGMLSDLTRRRQSLAANGVIFGASRIGVATAAHDDQPGCSRCGLCLDGCPHDLIYNAAHTLAQLRRNPRFRYIQGVYVRRYEDHPDHVRVTAEVIGGSETREFVADRLYVGCGALSTTRLVMESANRFDEPVRMLDSCYFIQPWLRWRATPGVVQEPMQTLSQLCLRLDQPAATPVHVLVYTYNDLLRRRLEATPLSLFPGLTDQLLNRILVVQGYLPSTQSPGLEVRIVAASNARPSSAVRVRALPNRQTGPALRHARRMLRRVARHAWAAPIPGTMIVGRPGKGYHFGGGFPMRASPKQFESDLLGRPFGASRVHLVDSSCFPDIPATNLTLTVMANAWRIASESCGGDQVR